MLRILGYYFSTAKKYPFSGGAITLGICAAIFFEVKFPFVYREISTLFSYNPTTVMSEKMFSLITNLALLYFFQWLSWRVVEIFVVPFEAKIMCDLERDCFSTIQRQSAHFFENSFSGSLIKKVSRFVNSFETIADLFFFTFLKNSLQIAAILFIFSSKELLFGLLFLGWILLFLGGNIFFARWKIKYDERTAAADSKVGSLFADAFANNATIRSFSAEKKEQERIDMATDNLLQKRQFSWYINALNFAAQGAMMFGIEIVLLFFMAQKWSRGEFSVGEFVFFQIFLFSIFYNLFDFGHSLQRLFSAIADAREMVNIFEQKVSVRDKKNARALKKVRGEIHFDAIDFSYSEGGEHFSHFSLHIPAGQRVALVGHSGAGKTTLVKLLLRFFDIQSGKITLDGNDISAVTQKSLRQNISLVPQNPELFHRTLRENIIFSHEYKSEKDIFEAANKARALDFINALPEKMNTIVGERGVKLSGGELQRVAIARAFLKDAPIIILDEASSALDSITEKHIQLAIFDVLKDRTAIVIAHRLSTILNMDRIIMLENGHIIEDGTHEELLKQKGKYAEMWREQSGGFLTE